MEICDYCVQGQGHREGSKCRLMFFLVDVFSLCMVVYYHEVMCHAEKLVHYLECQGHSEGLYDQNMTIFTISSKLLVPLQTRLVW